MKRIKVAVEFSLLQAEALIEAATKAPAQIGQPGARLREAFTRLVHARDYAVSGHETGFFPATDSKNGCDPYIPAGGLPGRALWRDRRTGQVQAWAADARPNTAFWERLYVYRGSEEL